ncbi:MAG: winged helix-turn-helix transcriptional regulator [Anaerolineae bacterium]|nr:winged helix-turn-helix transcriptional regulator [Anaerolineae bacterium]
MLRQILDRLRKGGTWTIEGLARELGVSPPLVEAAIEDLTRRGYLALVGGGCSGACASCPAAGNCVRATAGDSPHHRIWGLVR